MPGRMEFDFRFGGSAKRPDHREEDGGSMRMLLMGDFSGRENRGAIETGAALASRSPVAIDIDTFDKVMGRLAPRLSLPAGGPGAPVMSLEPGRLEDFHPDELFRRLSLFEALRRMRQRLLDPVSFPEAAAELRQTVGEGPPGDGRRGTGAQPQDENDPATLERLLGRGPAGAGQAPPRAAGATVDISGFVRSIVAPYITPGPDPFQAQYVAWVDEAIAGQMRGLLHDPAFQALEATWRGVQFLVSRLDLGEELRLFLLDVSRSELAADLAVSDGDLSRSGLYRLLVEHAAKTHGGQPWGLMAGFFTFGAGADDVALLAALGAVGSQAGGPFLAAASPSLVGCGSLAATPDPASWSPLAPEDETRWRELRRCRQASFVGLALPRLLMRLPYGARTDPVERFTFEELTPGQDHESYLWGHPASGCAMLIGRAWLEKGPDMEPGDQLDIEDLPVHSWQEGGSTRMKPCAEPTLGERATRAILDRGLIPVLSHSNSDRVRVARFQSIADPPAPLSGPWR